MTPLCERKEEASSPSEGTTQSVDIWQLGPFSLGVLVKCRFSGSTWGSLPGRRRELWNLCFD